MNEGFFDNVAALIEQARKFVGRTANLTMCATYFEVGRMIIEEEQGGEERAKYGRKLLGELSAYLSKRVGKGFSETNLRNARKFYQVYALSIQQTLSAELGDEQQKKIQQTMSAESGDATNNPIQQSMLAESGKHQALISALTGTAISQKGQATLFESYPFTLSWSHYLILMRIKDEQERRFYEIEATKRQWDVRYLQRQYGSSLYERLALSRDKDEIMRLAINGQTIEKPQDILKNPLSLEFLDMEERTGYSETVLERAILSKLQRFLLELGSGFLFEARQKRFTFDEKHYKVDLVTYNRLLKCYVLIDLKTDTLEHQDLGQMQMYVNYFDRYVKTKDENPTIGILLCREKDDAIVELTLPTDANIYASEYSLYLPDKTLLQQKLAEWVEEFEEAQAILETVAGGDAE